MGWLKKINKWFEKTFLPESTPDFLLSSAEQKARQSTKDNEAAAAAAPIAKADAPITPNITDVEAEEVSSKRLARLGRYFTSPLGVLSGASTGSQKVFS